MVASASAPPFQRLERQARRVQVYFIVLIWIIALVPTAVFVMLELGHLRRHGAHAAERLQNSVVASILRSGPDLPEIRAQVTAEMHENDIVFVRLVRDADTLTFGRPGQRLFHTLVRVPLPSEASPFLEMQVEADDRDLPLRIGRVLGIHVTVACVLALIAYWMPMRALSAALEEGRRTYDALVHADKLSAIGEIYAGLTHEINNPLGIILSRVRQLLADAKERELPPDLVEDVTLIERHGTRIAETIRNLLAFSRKTNFELTEADLNAIIEDVVSLLGGAFAKQGVRVHTDLDRSIPAVRASADHLKQVFVNLLNNARDAMPEGGTVILRSHVNGSGAVVVEVEDTGTGIAPENMTRIFDPFFTTKPVGKGTGMGLAVSYGIVRGHGGDIQVENAPGRGALFRLLLPVRGSDR